MTSAAVAPTLPVTLSLFRTRAARFCDDPAAWVLAEHLDERYLAGISPHHATLRAVERFLDMVRHGEPPTIPTAQLADVEKLDLAAALAARHAHTQHVTRRLRLDLGMAVFIVGAPRSGTSYLFNLLAAHGAFAFFTNVSCWAWPTYGLAHTAKKLFTDLGDHAFAIDTKALKLDPRLIVPAEAEDIFQRAIPCYTHLGGHEYQLTNPKLADPDVLDRAIAAHLDYLRSRRFLAKSPFNTFRIVELHQRFGARCRFIHLCRNGYDVAASIRANGFTYHHRGRRLTAEAAWATHVDTALRHASRVPMLLLRYEDLIDDPDRELARLFDWLGLDLQPRPIQPAQQWVSANRDTLRRRHHAIPWVE